MSLTTASLSLTFVRMSLEYSLSFIEYLRNFLAIYAPDSTGASLGLSSASGSNEDTLTLKGFCGAFSIKEWKEGLGAAAD